MLVISRRVNGAIQIGNDIEITIIQVRGDVVRVGINAPPKMQVWRKELWDSIVGENRKAAEAAEKSPGELTTPRLPVSAFSKLAQLRVVPAKKQRRWRRTAETC
ncbi:MAG: carbon storage regulator CsrA [Synergistaceae bacterium]|jgi:carbon storage regulator|nr:carbon storage regulator CsrA [Synergistaceae bacterium]